MNIFIKTKLDLYAFAKRLAKHMGEKTELATLYREDYFTLIDSRIEISPSDDDRVADYTQELSNFDNATPGYIFKLMTYLIDKYDSFVIPGIRTSGLMLNYNKSNFPKSPTEMLELISPLLKK